ncbi:MAG TPA: histidine phosphatase family protein [Candidatus Saccharimonadales bacterium]|nr:histidine phosphatase family protein [Candidatus Saccharimonadales bacterium]
MALYFVRHGQTRANLEQIFDGQRQNMPLTAVGREQAHETAKRLADLSITRIISSDLKRAEETADIIAAELGVQDVSRDNRVREYDQGILSGQPIRAVSADELKSTPQAETFDAFYGRIRRFLADYREATDDGNTVLVSHGGVLKAYKDMRAGLEPEMHFPYHGVENGAIIALKTDTFSQND